MTEAVVHTSNPWIQEFLLGLEFNNVLISFLAVGWVITESDQGDNALAMTDAPELFELIHESFSKDGNMPTVHAPDDTTLPVDTLPLQRATAYNLPDGMRSHEVIKLEHQQLLEEIFTDLQKAHDLSNRLIYGIGGWRNL